MPPHNLRVALDHLIWELVRRDGGVQDRRLQFPMGIDRAKFELACEKIDTPSQAVRDMLKSCEAFPGGRGHDLYALHQLDITDKHKILTPVLQASKVTDLFIRNWKTNVRIPLSTFRVSSSGLNPQGSSSLILFPEEYVLEPEATITPDLYFGDVDFVQGEPILPTLRRFADAVSETIQSIKSSIRQQRRIGGFHQNSPLRH